MTLSTLDIVVRGRFSLPRGNLIADRLEKKPSDRPLSHRLAGPLRGEQACSKRCHLERHQLGISHPIRDQIVVGAP
ncbi:hypothetical protein, partial [Nonomuraea sp. NPDC049480]|uniref:hypothetical protein n=1 Tax=Nonomuraea sp. NPDC049480 TaxID=3364353 RepID=UPI0037AFE39F